MIQNLTKKAFLLIFCALFIFSPYPMFKAQADEVLLVPLDEHSQELNLPQYQVKSTSQHRITAYTSEVAQTDDTPCITANGYNVCDSDSEDTIAANFLPFGTKVRIPDLFGDRVFVVRDRMNRRHANKVDIWMRDKQAAIEFGSQLAKIEVLSENN